jgi:uncharacterized protein YjbI with pentapeptide repeats
LSLSYGVNLRGANLAGIDLSNADLSGADLTGANLRGAMLLQTNMRWALLTEANLAGADLEFATLIEADLVRANLSRTCLTDVSLVHVNLSYANLSYSRLDGAELLGTTLIGADLQGADLTGAELTGAPITKANLRGVLARRADFSDADLRGANLSDANLREARLCNANLTGALLESTVLVRANVAGAIFSGARVYGASAWDLSGEPRSESGLIITTRDEAIVTVDRLDTAQFVHLLLSNREIGRVIDTIGKKGVLILGRFGDRKHVLDSLRDRLRELGWVPIVFDFRKPTSKDLTETVRTLAGMSAFIVADITCPKSVPQEAQAIIPDYMVPFLPLIEEGEEPWDMFKDLWLKHRDWVLEPLYYPSIEDLLPKLKSAVVEPALDRRRLLLAAKAETMGKRTLADYRPDSG